MMALPLVAGEALGVKYDEIVVLRLKQPEMMKKKSPRLIPNEDFSRYVLSAHRLEKRFHERADKLFSKDANFDNGSADSRVQLFALAFYKDDQCVLTISPNLTGGDIYASGDKGDDPRTLSEQQKDKFLQIVYLSMISGDAAVELGVNKDKRVPVTD